MPLLDHFHPPLSEQRYWEGFHSTWASSIAHQLNDQLLGIHLLQTSKDLCSPRNSDSHCSCSPYVVDSKETTCGGFQRLNLNPG